ncbi:hypothetical protein WIW50_05025 [Flavobacteriaceae bacterium 3-367]|uniref:hypothetical protein n=1 Tax=Eudoraea algarum TaxID=3417568 RepID=UPI00326C5AEA
MTYSKGILAVFFLFLTAYSSAQESQLLSEVPVTKEQFIASEKKVLGTIEWLENTPINEEKEKHKAQYALLVAWLTNSPTVTLELNANVLTFTNKNSELLVFFMAGWTKYALENNYSKDVFQGSLAGIRSAIKIYQTGGLRKDKKMQKLVELEEQGGLEQWVSEQLSK